jgi:hypothetical protein
LILDFIGSKEIYETLIVLAQKLIVE